MESALSRTCLLLGLLWVTLWCTSPAQAGWMSQPRLWQVGGNGERSLPEAITAIAEDRDGYIWFATYDGLVRYDGVGFRIWREVDGLPASTVTSLHVGKDNRIWIGTLGGGLAVLHQDRRSFRVISSKANPVVRNDMVLAVTATPDGAIWFGTLGGGLYRIGEDGALVHHGSSADGGVLPGNNVWSLLASKDGQLWVGTDKGVGYWRDGYFVTVSTQSLEVEDVPPIVPMRNGDMWLNAPDGPRRLGAASRWKDVPLGIAVPPGTPTLLGLDNDGGYWFAGEGKLRRSDGSQVQLATTSGGGPGDQVQIRWTRMLQSRDGGLWFVSNNSGAWQLPANWGAFKRLRQEDGSAQPLANSLVIGVSQSRGHDLLVAGDQGALQKIDLANGAVRTLYQRPGFISEIAQAADGALWFDLDTSVVRLQAGDGGAARQWDAESATDPTPEFMALGLLATDEGIWLATQEGVVQLRDAQGHVLRTIDLRKQARSNNLGIRMIYSGPDGQPWLSTIAEPLAWNPASARFMRPRGIPRRWFGATTASADGGQLWAVTDEGIEHYVRGKDGYRYEATVFANKEPRQPSIRSLVRDRDGMLWAGGRGGLRRIDPANGKVRTFGMRDGLPAQSVYPLQLLSDGQIAYATGSELVLFQPRDLHPVQSLVPVVIEGLHLRREGKVIDALPSQALNMSYQDRDLRVVARVMDYNNPAAHRYRFRLRGFDSDWVETDTLGERTFSQLPPGSYTLDVQGRSEDSDWSSAKAVALQVAPPWWRTPWAYALWILAALGVIALLASAYRQRIRRQHAYRLSEQQRSLAIQASDAKSRFLANLGHEIRTPMTGVLGMSELLLAGDLQLRQRSQVEAIQRAGEHLLRLVNDALDLARIEAGRLELEQGNFEPRMLVDEITGLMAAIAERRGLQFTDKVDPDVPHLVHGDRRRIAQILLNLIGNAIKFTEHGFVALEVQRPHPDVLRFLVADSGPGLNLEQQQRIFRRFEQADGVSTQARFGGSGLGLAISQELAAAMKGRIRVHSVPGEGTRFEVDLPLIAGSSEPLARASDSALPMQALRLLLVEDDPNVAEVLTGLLQAQGHHVTHAAHGLAALTEVAMHDFDAALLDLDLPGIDGLALARQLRRQAFVQPIVAVTARADAQAEPAAMEAGFDGFLRKPLTGEMLADALQAAMGKRP